jgi:hypothetical protein
MPASEARINANPLSSARSTGPRTEEGKARSRGNALKHGLTDEGIVLPDEDAAEVERRLAAFQDELQPEGEVGRTLVRRAALLSVRMDRCVEQETAALSERVLRARSEFVAPEGCDAAESARLRAEAGRRAMFDPSREATLARKYEAAAERGFFRALKELRQLDRQARSSNPGASAEAFREELGSFLPYGEMDREFDAMSTAMRREMPFEPSGAVPSAYLPTSVGRVDVPITIGRAR